ncbi:MAG: hypothetical protein M1819_002312 [Sarea resinae]|nr:MAG: hypothetical protein M1819_002312 [Sarea resinae]
MHDQTTKTESGISDKRLRILRLYLGTWMLQVAGIQPPMNESPSEWAEFRSCFHQYREGDMDSEGLQAFRVQTKRLWNHVLSLADIIFTTCSNEGNAFLRAENRFDAIVVDEVCKGAEHEMSNVHRRVCSPVFLLVGDQKQLHPLALARFQSNAFVANLRMSLLACLHFCRLIFDVQHRMFHALGAWVSHVLYDGQLQHASNTTNPNSLTAALSDYNQSNSGINSALVFLDILSGQAIRSSLTKSTKKVQNMLYVLALVTRLITAKVVVPADILFQFHTKTISFCTELHSPTSKSNNLGLTSLIALSARSMASKALSMRSAFWTWS